MLACPGSPPPRPRKRASDRHGCTCPLPAQPGNGLPAVLRELPQAQEREPMSHETRRTRHHSARFPGSWRGGARAFRCLGLTAFVCALVSTAWASPPDYATFGREQRLDHVPQAMDVLRIWIVNVEQGDGIIIQLPRRYDYDPDPDDGQSERTERVDILIDGGSTPRSEDWRMQDFLERLYAGGRPAVEYTVITHHDMDHVVGLIHLLEGSEATFDTVYHNGLASYKPGHRGFPQKRRPDRPAVYTYKRPRLRCGMAFLYPEGHEHAGRIDGQYLIEDLASLRAALGAQELHGLYEELAEAIIWNADDYGLSAFQRAYAGAAFVTEREQELGRDLSGVEFDVLWPLEVLSPYGRSDWGQTINGNSVTFRLRYGEFEMLFTGDHNEKSEEALLEHLRAEGRLDLLDCDVLKVPHHGSSHACERFLKGLGSGPVISVASMGDEGFKSKAMNPRAWQHPSTDVIRWLGGSHRVYHTFIHERRFTWPDITTETARGRMIEQTHILIETDGRWFRLVELPLDHAEPNQPPSVQQTRRGNGTRWIRARGEN